MAMFDYATGKWAPIRKFRNYITGEWIDRRALDGRDDPGWQDWDPVLGVAAYVQIAREGWGEQKSQNGGANPVR
jgi:hypothetical protein